jgi:hypothetical protein
MFFMSIVTVPPLPLELVLFAVLVAGAAWLDEGVDDDELLLELPQPAAASASTASRGSPKRFMSTWDDVMALILPVEGR